MKILSKELVQVEKEIESFEKQVDFELIPVIAEESSYTEHVSWILSLILILFSVTGLELGLDHFLYDSWYDHTLFYVCSIIISIGASRLLSRRQFIKRLFITEKERNRQVHEKAQVIFFKKRLGDIKSQNALLVYISEMEHRIEIIPDSQHTIEGLDKITQQAVELLTSAFKKRLYAEGLITVTQYLKEKLQTQFPRQGACENVVPNKLIHWRD